VLEFNLGVGNDHVATFTKFRKPIVAIEELIWNALDADATSVGVHLARNNLGALQSVVVADNGRGIPYDACEVAFGNLGSSPKLLARSSPSGRLVHGKDGRGRFRALGVGTQVTWRSRYAARGGIKEFTIKIRRGMLRKIAVSDEQKCPGAGTGVEVTIGGIDRAFASLCDCDAAAEELAKRLALYLKQYPGISITYGNAPVDPQKLESHSEVIPIFLDDGRGGRVPGDVMVIEWKVPFERALYLCDQDGFAHHDTSPGVRAPGFHFTAYLKSSLVRDLAESGAFAVEAMHPVVESTVASVKDALRDYFRRRAATRTVDLVADWKSQHIYPYDLSRSDPLGEASREVFNVCAVTVNEYLPNFEKSEASLKRLTFRLIKEAIESNPSSLQTILRQLLELPEEKQNELAELLEKTKLSAIINAARTVIDRLTFLGSLDHLLFGEFKTTLLERQQLHRILVNELWLFGEQYALGIDDQSLSSLLKKHVRILGRDELDNSGGPVRDLDGKDGIVDLMLHRRYPQRGNGRFEHLVIELKRPSCKIGSDEISQIEKYAFAISADERFEKRATKWTFLLIGNEFTEYGEQRADVQNKDHGNIHTSSDGNLTISIAKWATIVSDAKWRYNHLREKLELEVSSTDAMEYLRSKYPLLIPQHGESCD
jgi:hypothetical protein